MTYRELLYKATRLIDKGEITLGEYEEMTKPLDREVEQEPRWIPVSEKLPEVGHRVIFSMKNDEIYIGTLHTPYNDLKITLELTGIGYVYSFENVVAWMPLPQPYKAESEDKE